MAGCMDVPIRISIGDNQMQSLFSGRWVYKSSREFAIKTKNKDVCTKVLRGM